MMDSKGNIYIDPDEKTIKEKKLIPVEPRVLGMSRAERRAHYRAEAKRLRKAKK